MCYRALQGYFTWVNITYPLWEEVTPQCASSKRKGTLSQCYSSPTFWVALGEAVVDLCVVRSYRLPYMKDQEAYTGRWKGQLLWHFGRDPTFGGRPTWLGVTDWKGTSWLRMYPSFPEWGNGDVMSLCHSYCTNAELPGHQLGSSAKAWINAVHLLPLILTLWSTAARCKLPHANVHWVI